MAVLDGEVGDEAAVHFEIFLTPGNPRRHSANREDREAHFERESGPG
jgi:hypothetical protein